MRVRQAVFGIFILLLTFSLIACGREQKDQENDDAFIYVYDLSDERYGLEAHEYRMHSAGDDVSGCVGELLQRLIDGPEGDRKGSAIPGEITDVTYIIGAQTVNVDFEGDLTAVSQLGRLSCEAAVTKTLCGLDDVMAVSFSVNKAPLCDMKGEPVGLLTADSFTGEGAGMAGDAQKTELHLFFADDSGQSLVEKAVTVTYDGNIPMDRLVVENLIAGPRSTDSVATINPSTSIIYVATRDGICYVNLNREFRNKITNVSDEVMIYSLVNSLTWLENVNKVQILIDGDRNVRIGDMDISKLFERNLEID